MRLCGEQRQGQDQGSCPVLLLPPRTTAKKWFPGACGKVIGEEGPGALRPGSRREARGRVSLVGCARQGLGSERSVGKSQRLPV